jgi:hypothetical protein
MIKRKRSSNKPARRLAIDAGAQELAPAALRALAEAEARRRDAEGRRAFAESAAKEIGGRKGPDPARYGDWEVKGIACDF